MLSIRLHQLTTTVKRVSSNAVSSGLILRRITSVAHRAPEKGEETLVNTGLTIALVGRPNVGKSTLFNRLINQKEGSSNVALTRILRSVVHPLPGVTRDSREGPGVIGDLKFNVIDTAGLERAVSNDPAAQDNLQKEVQNASQDCSSSTLVTKGALDPNQIYRKVYARMAAQTSWAIKNADAIFFVTDAKDGITPLDEELAGWLRKKSDTLDGSRRDITVIANKVDCRNTDEGIVDAWSLGLGDPIGISAEYGLGMADLFTVVDRLHRKRTRKLKDQLSTINHAPSFDPNETFESEGPSRRDTPLEKLIVAIIGRPNVGKSTLSNQLLGSERSMMASAWGVTRDSVLTKWQLPESEPVWLVDTAGIRTTKNSCVELLEELSVRSSLRALSIAHICVVVLDASDPFTKQDLRIIHKIISEGRGLILVLNKIDLVPRADRPALRDQVARDVKSSLNEIPGVECLELSSLNLGKNNVELHKAIQRTKLRWEKRIATSALTFFVRGHNERLFLGAHPSRMRRCVKFVTQIKTRPPVFRFSGSAGVSSGYLRGLVNSIRTEFGLEGVPIRYVVQRRNSTHKV